MQKIKKKRLMILSSYAVEPTSIYFYKCI